MAQSQSRYAAPIVTRDRRASRRYGLRTRWKGNPGPPDRLGVGSGSVNQDRPARKRIGRLKRARSYRRRPSAGRAARSSPAIPASHRSCNCGRRGLCGRGPALRVPRTARGGVGGNAGGAPATFTPGISGQQRRLSATLFPLSHRALHGAVVADQSRPSRPVYRWRTPMAFLSELREAARRASTPRQDPWEGRLATALEGIPAMSSAAQPCSTYWTPMQHRPTAAVWLR
jgi:hypothetical protein